MLKIRLSRVGKRHSPIYRLVVAEKSRAVKREYIEILGLYNPTQKENKFQCNKDRVGFWLSRGAQPSETVNNLLCDFGILPKNQKLKIVYGKKQKKKDLNKDDADNNKIGTQVNESAKVTEKQSDGIQSSESIEENSDQVSRETSSEFQDENQTNEKQSETVDSKE